MVQHTNIHEAKIAVMQAVEYVQKTGKMEQGARYKYVTVDEVIAKLRPAMVEHGIHFAPTAMNVMHQEQYQTAKGTLMNRVILGVGYRLSHVTGSFEEGFAVGEGSDSGDKACNKAMTAAKKYALLQSFCLETGEDDPDHDPSAEQERAKKPANGNGKPKGSEPPTKLQEFSAKIVSLKPMQLVEKIGNLDKSRDAAIEHFGSADDVDTARAMVVAQLYKQLDIDVGFKTTPKPLEEFERWVKANAIQYLSQIQQDTLLARIDKQYHVAEEKMRA